MDEGKNESNDSDSVKPSEDGTQQPTLYAADLRECRLGGKKLTCLIDFKWFSKLFYCFIISSNLLSYLFPVLCNIPREGSSGKQGQLEITPVARAIARHMSVDLSPEGFAARNRTGIAIIVFGGPLTGEENTQIEICHI